MTDHHNMFKTGAQHTIFFSRLSWIAISLFCFSYFDVSYAHELGEDAAYGHTRTPTLLIQTGHSEGINFVSFSRDERFVLTASGDHTVRLWDTSSAVELRSFKGSIGKFIPNDHTI